MSRYILALDQGTSSSRAILFDRQGKVVASAHREFPQHYPQPGWVEHDPEELWHSQIEAAREALDRAGASASELAAIGIANQRETTLVWDRSTGQPIANAIVWQDRRTAVACARLREEGYEPLIRSKTGLILDSYFSATKLAWLLDNVPDARRRAEAGDLAFGTVDTFLLWRLSGGKVHATDPSNASRTMLFDIDRMDWLDELLELFRIPRSLLPVVVPSSGVVGETDFFGGSVPIAGRAGDQQAATFGQACFEPGMAKNTYGTGCFLLMNQGLERRAVQDGLLGTVGWTTGSLPASYAVEGSVFVAGAAVQWLRDELGLLTTAAESEALAASVPDTAGVVLVPAFVGLGAPHWDPFARGALVGLTRGAGKAHVVRAALESIAFQSRDVIDEMQKGAGPRIRELRVDGGASRNDFLMQFQADLLGIPVVRPRVTETTALGAAYLAGLGVGLWRNLGEIGSQWEVERRFEPAMDAEERENRYREWLRAVERAKGWAG